MDPLTSRTDDGKHVQGEEPPPARQNRLTVSADAEKKELILEYNTDNNKKQIKAFENK